MFFLMSKTVFASYADNNTSCIAAGNVNDVIKILENDPKRLFKWFSDNQMKANKDNCHLLIVIMNMSP